MLARLLAMALLTVLSTLVRTAGGTQRPVAEWLNAGDESGARPGASAQQAAGAIQIAAQPVYRGCNVIVVHASAGTAWSDVVSHFSDQSSVVSVWRFDNTSKRYHGVYFADPVAPTDGPAGSDIDPFGIFACVSRDGAVG